MRNKLNLPGLKISVPAPVLQEVAAPAESRPRPSLPSPDVSLKSRRSDPALASLNNEITRVRADIKAFKQPGAETLAADLSNVRSIVDAQNRRKAGLNLHYHGSTASLVEALNQLDVNESHHQRAVFCVGSHEGSPHHAAVDIRREPGKPMTLVVMEPAPMGIFAHVESHSQFIGAIKDTPGLADARIVVINGNIQKSPADCVMFSLSFASKMHKEAADISKWHDRLANDEPIAPDSVTDTLPSGVKVLNGHDLLPASFLKHAHSMTDLLKARPELANAVVGRNDEGAPETLVGRKGRFSEVRYTKDGQQEPNTSIEYKRYKLLKNSIETLA